MNPTTPPRLLMTPSYLQRSLAVLASLLITSAMLAGNLQLAQAYSHAMPCATDTAQATPATPATRG